MKAPERKNYLTEKAYWLAFEAYMVFKLSNESSTYNTYYDVDDSYDDDSYDDDFDWED